MQIIAYVHADAHGIRISNENNLLHFQDLFTGELAPGFVPLFLLFHLGFGPGVAGLFVIAVFKGRAGLRDVFRQIVRVRIPLRWILTIVLMPLAMAPLFLLYLIIFTGLSEEIGWRGYALPELQSKFSAEKSVLDRPASRVHEPGAVLPGAVVEQCGRDGHLGSHRCRGGRTGASFD